jgi:cell division protein FtsI (penicillin-binding protein 3)
MRETMAGQPTGVSPHERMRKRSLVLKIGLLLFFLVLVVRLVQIQVIKAAEYREIARRQYEARVTLPAARGFITDRNGKVLVSNAIMVTFGADPKIAGKERDQIAVAMARTFRRPREVYLNAMRDNTKRFVWLEREVEPQRAARVPSTDLRGLIVMQDPRRLYHYERTAGQLIGVTGRDHVGLSGLELQYDRWLRGTDGYLIMQRDALRRTRPSADYPRVEPVDGQNLVLTIDAEYQQVVEEELAKGVQRTKAESGLVVMVDPLTGELLAVAHVPSVDPNNTASLEQSTLRNRTLTDTFEPGSVFKVVTATAALEKGVVRTDEMFYGEKGKYVMPMPRGKPRTVTDTHPLGNVSFRQAVEQSSNIVMAKIASRIGAQTMYTTARALGFGTRTGIELPGEVGGDLNRPSEWSAFTLHSLSYGYEVTATPLQIAMAYAAVANKGKLMKPYVVRQTLNAAQEIVTENQPQMVRQVMSEKTAATLTDLFEGVVERGTGKSARVEGLRIAGKTGTSKKVVGGRYGSGNYTASFVGFFPADNPHIVCLVMLDSPREAYYGGLVSAPIFKGIAEKIFAMAGRSHTEPVQAIAGNSTRHAVPDVVNLKIDDAVATLHASGFEPDIQGDGAIVVGQSPAPGAVLGREARVAVKTRDGVAKVSGGVAFVPDIRGLTIRRAINSLAAQRLDAVVIGTGTVVGQSPAPGERLRQGASVILRCEPRSPTTQS